ncbi:MAG: T9SS C-terminal target domain-containing protein [Saprospirales bacterium]|nr:MAG: T9SS C-terminal target domain-containing protein [Saprospirales bacterium]
MHIKYALVGWSGIDPVEIRLYDISGREVYYNAVQLGIPDYYLDLAGIVAGVYIVRVRDRLGGVSTGRLVVLR